MSVRIQGLEFEGPYTHTDALLDRSGIYAILTDDPVTTYKVIDVGESGEVKTRIENHDRKPCWTRNNKGRLYVAVLYTPGANQAGRVEIEQQLRSRINPVCGIR